MALNNGTGGSRWRIEWLIFAGIITSDHEHNLLSLENQIQSAIDLIPSNRNWVLFGIYTDQGVTGTSIEKRSGFKRLLDHCEAGYVDLIITKSVSRFSRNTEQLLSVLRKLKGLNIDVIFEKEGLRLSKMDDDFILTMYVAVAQKEAINVSKNSDWAHEKRALLGKPFFPRMFGYNISKGPGGQCSCRSILSTQPLNEPSDRRFGLTVKR